MSDSEQLTDEFFQRVGFDTSKEPFSYGKGTSLEMLAYKEYIRDGSGRFNGYTIVRPIHVTVHTEDDYRAMLTMGTLKAEFEGGRS